MIRFYFLTNMYPLETREYYDSHGFIQGGENITFIQRAILEGINEITKEKVNVINKLLVSKSKAYIVPSCAWENDECNGINFPYVNLPVFSSNLLYFQMEKYIKRIYCDDCCVLAYGVTNCNLKSLITIKKHKPNAKVGLIVPDIPEDTKTSNGLLGNLKNGITNKITNDLIHKAAEYIDCYFLFSKHMAHRMECHDKYTVLEGIATDFFDGISPKRIVPDDEIQIVYGGGLHKKYGADFLIDALKKINNANCHLVLCGTGDYVDKIKEAAQRDARIHYLGRVPRSELLSLELGADILVNPRTSKGKFTDYSFPSKNMEYLSSGRPVVAFKLGGIPDEYDEYINYPKNETVEGLSSMIEEIASNLSFYKLKAENAREYVISTKNKIVQSNRILAEFGFECD